MESLLGVCCVTQCFPEFAARRSRIPPVSLDPEAGSLVCQTHKSLSRDRLITVIAEHHQGSVSPVTYEAVSCAREIARIRSSRVVTITVGEDAEQIARDIGSKARTDLLALQVPGLDGYNSDAYRSLLAELLTELNPTWVCVPGTTQGLDFAPGLAVRLGAPCVSGIERIAEEAGALVFARTFFNGKIVAEVTSATRPTVLIVRPGAFKPLVGARHGQASLDIRTVEWKAVGTRALGTSTVEPTDSALAEASVIVSAGRGVGRKENLDLIRKVANLFSRAAIAGSRPLCDLGWLPYRSQVGQTGATVSPDLYFACGISGAQQHLAGMRGSKFTVAVNTDPNAAIFNEADLGILEDVEGFLTDLLEVWADMREQ